MKLFLLLFLSFTVQAAFASGPKVVLLTSLMELPSISKKQNQKLEMQIEKYFRKTYESSDYEIEVIHQSSPLILWNTLNNPNVLGLMWVSHAKKSRNLTAGISDPGTITDFNGNNIKNIFKKTTKSLKFLAVIGCEAKSILEAFNEEGVYSKDLVISSFEDKVGAISGFKKSLKESQKILLPFSSSDLEENQVSSNNTDHIYFDGLYSLIGKTIKIELGNNVIAIAKIDSDIVDIETQTDLINNSNVTITLLDEGDLPIINVSSNGEIRWKVLEKNGKALGGKKNLYIYKKF